jgi:hypothetical protein
MFLVPGVPERSQDAVGGSQHWSSQGKKLGIIFSLAGGRGVITVSSS